MGKLSTKYPEGGRNPNPRTSSVQRLRGHRLQFCYHDCCCSSKLTCRCYKKPPFQEASTKKARRDIPLGMPTQRELSTALCRAAETWMASWHRTDARPFPSVPNALSVENAFNHGYLFFFKRLMKGLPVLVYNILERILKTRCQCLMAKKVFLSSIQINNCCIFHLCSSQE